MTRDRKTAALTVLVVDDDPAIVRALTRVLSRAGHHVLGHVDAAGALEEIASANPIDVLVTDLHLGAMSGLDLIREMVDQSPTTRIIMLTGDDAAELQDLPAVALQKPVRGSRLLCVITGVDA